MHLKAVSKNMTTADRKMSFTLKLMSGRGKIPICVENVGEYPRIGAERKV